MLPSHVIEAWLRDLDVEQGNCVPENGNCVPWNSSPLPKCSGVCPLPTPQPSASGRSTAKKRTCSPEPIWRSRIQCHGLAVIDVNEAQKMNLRKSPRKKMGQEKFMPLDGKPFAAAAEEEVEQEDEQELATPRPPSHSGASGKSRTDRRAGQQNLTGFDGTKENTPELQSGTVPEFQARKALSDLSVELESIGVGSSAARHDSQLQSSAASFPIASRESLNTKRSRSPVKGMSDLQLTHKPTKFQNTFKELPLDVADLYQQLKDISDGIGIDKVAKLGGRAEPMRPWTIKSDIAVNEAEAEHDLREILEICDATVLCNGEGASEAAWNDEVHSRILRLALRDIPGVRHHNITTARICPELTAKHLSGNTLSSKLVDYSINIVPSDAMWASMRELLPTQPYGLQTINQTRYDPVRFKPCAVSIETKVQGSEEEGKVQLAMWSSAYFARTRSFQQSMDRIGGLSTAGDAKPVSTITLPLLLAKLDQWSLLFARDCEDHIEVIGKLSVGDTGSLHGMYKLLCALRCLAGWSTGTFQQWVARELLRMNLSG